MSTNIIRSRANPLVRWLFDRLSLVRAYNCGAGLATSFHRNPHPPSRPGQHPVGLSAMAFPLSVAMHPSVVCISQWPTNSPTYPQSAQGKPTSLSFIWITAPTPRPCSEQCRHRGRHSDGNFKPRPFAHPKRHSDTALRWQRKIPLPGPPYFAHGNPSFPIEFAGRTSRIFFARLEPSSARMSL